VGVRVGRLFRAVSTRKKKKKKKKKTNFNLPNHGGFKRHDIQKQRKSKLIEENFFLFLIAQQIQLNVELFVCKTLHFHTTTTNNQSINQSINQLHIADLNGFTTTTIHCTTARRLSTTRNTFEKKKKKKKKSLFQPLDSARQSLFFRCDSLVFSRHEAKKRRSHWAKRCPTR
jgi:hypothetical protein